MKTQVFGSVMLAFGILFSSAAYAENAAPKVICEVVNAPASSAQIASALSSLNSKLYIAKTEGLSYASAPSISSGENRPTLICVTMMGHN